GHLEVDPTPRAAEHGREVRRSDELADRPVVAPGVIEGILRGNLPARIELELDDASAEVPDAVGALLEDGPRREVVLRIPVRDPDAAGVVEPARAGHRSTGEQVRRWMRRAGRPAACRRDDQREQRYRQQQGTHTSSLRDPAPSALVAFGALRPHPLGFSRRFGTRKETRWPTT